MKLGNSNGNNRGKKYFIRGRDDVNPQKLYTEAAADFARWFEANHARLKRDVRGTNRVDEDAFNETYLRIHELILYTGKQIRDYKAFFHRAYYTNFVQRSMHEQRYCSFFDHVDVEQSSGQIAHHGIPKIRPDEDNELYFEELDAQIRGLQDDIMDYVHNKYRQQEFEIFKMYMHLKPAINYHALARITGLKYHRIQSMVSAIVTDLKGHEEFCRRRKNMSFREL